MGTKLDRNAFFLFFAEEKNGLDILVFTAKNKNPDKKTTIDEKSQALVSTSRK